MSPRDRTVIRAIIKALRAGRRIADADDMLALSTSFALPPHAGLHRNGSGLHAVADVDRRYADLGPGQKTHGCGGVLRVAGIAPAGEDGTPMMLGADPFELPDFLRVTPEEQQRRRQYWKGRRLRWTREMNFTEPSDRAVQDPGTIRLLAERAAAEKARAKAKAAADQETRLIKARQRANPGNSPTTTKTDGDDHMAKKAAKKAKRAVRKARKSAAKKTARKSREKQVTTRFKTSAPKPPKALSKPRLERQPRAASKTPRAPRAPRVAADDKAKRLAAKMAATGAEKVKAPKADSKKAKLVAFLREAPRALTDITAETGMLPHSARAALTRLGFEISTEKKDGVTMYHISADAPAKVKTASTD